MCCALSENRDTLASVTGVTVPAHGILKQMCGRGCLPPRLPVPEFGKKERNYFKVKRIYCTLPCIMQTHVFGPNFKGKKSFNFLIQFLFMFRYLFFVCYKGIFAFIFEHYKKL